ncbi:hypothetical protein CNMCM7691_003861 [Aspergillus felis]|uniref:holocytochrome-c synthase n=1 Tax=Aspergillus felis TaxID=1287682 RepID=A0A8H6VAH7_9EURO|nr:hypothetical protein CNMCM7691_003861 [Aspergillus felis]
MFTFIDHDDDLSSKRIKDANARKAIRSHVMRDVRRRERLAGLKRVPKRESRLKQPLPPSASISPQVESATSEYLLEAGVASPLPASSSLADSNPAHSHLISPQGRRRPIVWRAGYSAPPTPAPSPLAFPPSWLLDPFVSLPGAHEAPSRIARLVFYWKSVFVPMTFPEEHKINEQAETGLMVKSSFSDPGSFFGLMAMCAAHRAVLAGYHIGFSRVPDSSRPIEPDADYYFMKVRCMQEMNAKMRDSNRALSDESFDTMVNLLTSTLIIGMFDEARIHLGGLKRMVELRGGLMADGINQSSMLAAIITADVKAASGLMTKPLFSLPWDPRPVPSSAQQRIRPPPSSVLTRLGAAFFANNLLSLPLLRILHVMRDIVLYSQAYRERPASVYPEDHELFRVPGCPMHASNAPPALSSPSALSDTSSSCPVRSADSPFHVQPKTTATDSTRPPAPETRSTLSKLNPLNYMFSSISQERAPNQTVDLPVEREPSSIPRGDTDGNWEYPSPQQMYNAMLRKGYTDTPQDAVEAMVAVHNFLNEGAWAEIVGWERIFAKGLGQAWEKCRKGEQGIALEAMKQEMTGNIDPASEPRLLRFKGRPQELTPKAQILQALGRLYPAKFETNPPFDRHDWFVLRQTPSGPKEVRYVIDYYSGPPEPTGEPVFYLDIRPALDTPTAAVERLMRWGGDVWWRASGGAVRENNNP